jgi:outer membrane protein assembly factor BamB
MTRPVVLLAAGATVVALAALALLLYDRERRADVRCSSTVEFVATEIATGAEGPMSPADPRGPDGPGAVEEAFAWPTFGYNEQRLRSLFRLDLRPPFRRAWTFGSRSLLEFPPVLGHGRLYLPTFDGRLYALDPVTGKEVWSYDSGHCAWASPAVSGELVVQTFIGSRGSCQDDVPGVGGEVVAFDGATGRVRWRRVHGRDESSPVVVDGLVYGGDWSGEVYALDAETGAPRWTFRTGAEVKGSAALDAGRVFIGSYDGHVYAFDARDGTLLWRASAQPRLGTRGRFYSTPAVAYGRVYIGSTDGKVYSFGATSGKLRWSASTGSYVYASPAIWRQLVLIGSYDGFFYALDAASGAVRWRFDAKGRISGSATVIDGIVYFSTFEERTYGLNALTGRLVWTFADGFYSPVVADRDRLYLAGAGRLYALVER